MHGILYKRMTRHKASWQKGMIRRNLPNKKERQGIKLCSKKRTIMFIIRKEEQNKMAGRQYKGKICFLTAKNSQ